MTNYTWDLSSLYQNEELIFKDIITADELAQSFVEKYNNIKLDKEHLKISLDDYFQITRLLGNAMTYAHHKLDECTTDHDSIKLEAKVKTEALTVYSKLSFYMPLLTSDIELLNSCMDAEECSVYHQVLLEIKQNASHTLDSKSENLLSLASESLSAASNIYETLTNGDMTFEDVLDGEGDSKPMSHGLYGVYLHSEDRVLRKNAFEAMLNNFAKLNLTLTKTYTAQIDKDMFAVKSREYENTRQRALFGNNIKEEIYDNLLEVVNRNIETNHKYVSLRKCALDLDELHLYDMYTPIVKDVSKTYSFEEAKAIIIEALKPLGEEYNKILQSAFDERWVDVYERPGKRSGAYSGGSYDSKPFILLNYTESLNDVYTLAHELGHSIHSYLANHKQEYHNSNYVIFIAEIASTLNELLLTDYLYENADSDAERANILNYKLEQYRTTVIRQTMFAEFEYKSKSTIESGTKLANTDLNEMYYKMNEAYFGSDVVVDELIKYEWTRIPHFYYNYYVYQYATSFCYSVEIFERIKKDNSFSKDYLDFLAIGGSMGAIESLASIDIDALEKAPYQAAFDDFKKTLELFEKLI